MSKVLCKWEDDFGTQWKAIEYDRGIEIFEYSCDCEKECKAIWDDDCWFLDSKIDDYGKVYEIVKEYFEKKARKP